MQELHASIRSQLAVQAADLRALAHRLTSGPEAEDCVQNTMVAALSQREPPRQLRPWLRRVLRNEIHAHHRIGARRRNREHQIATGEPMPTLDDHAEREQIVAALRMVLDALEEPYRSTLRRRFLLEHPTTRIARDEGCSPATVRWRAHEGLRRMRRMLDERFEGRQQWLGGMALYASGPVDGATPVIGGRSKDDHDRSNDHRPGRHHPDQARARGHHRGGSRPGKRRGGDHEHGRGDPRIGPRALRADPGRGRALRGDDPGPRGRPDPSVDTVRRRAL